MSNFEADLHLAIIIDKFLANGIKGSVMLQLSLHSFSGFHLQHLVNKFRFVQYYYSALFLLSYSFLVNCDSSLSVILNRPSSPESARLGVPSGGHVRWPCAFVCLCCVCHSTGPERTFYCFQYFCLSEKRNLRQINTRACSAWLRLLLLFFFFFFKKSVKPIFLPKPQDKPSCLCSFLLALTIWNSHDHLLFFYQASFLLIS